MKIRLPFRSAGGCLMVFGLFLSIGLAGCGPSGDTPDQPSRAIDAKSTEDRLAEVEQAYAGQSGQAKPTQSTAYVTARVEDVPPEVVPGKEYDLALVAEIDEGWHINANPATLDYLIPTKLSLEETAGVRLVSVSYPEGKAFRLATFDEAIAVYEKAVRIPFRVAVAGDAKTGTLTARGRLSVQACNDRTCLAPGQMPVQFTLKIKGS